MFVQLIKSTENKGRPGTLALGRNPEITGDRPEIARRSPEIARRSPEFAPGRPGARLEVAWGGRGSAKGRAQLSQGARRARETTEEGQEGRRDEARATLGEGLENVQKPM